MNPRAKLFLAIAGIGGALVVMTSKRRTASAAEPPDELQFPPIAPPLPVIPPAPGEFIPAPIQPPQDEEDERDDLVLAPSPLPPFVPPPISNTPPRPQPPVFVPPPVFQPAPAPPVFAPPSLPPDFVATPILGPSFPVRPPAQRQPAQLPLPLPIEIEPEQPTNIPDDTAAVLATMLPRESTADWKREEAILKNWQRSRGLTADGKFGPGGALVMAQETGLLPIVRFWPRGSLIETGAVSDYQDKLFQLAATAPEPRKSQLMAAAEREQGQAFARNPGPITPTISI
jgi:hypothetical protein